MGSDEPRSRIVRQEHDINPSLRVVQDNIAVLYLWNHGEDLPDPVHRKILTLYFLDARVLSMRQVAEEVHYSERWVYEKYKEALKDCSEVQLET